MPDKMKITPKIAKTFPSLHQFWCKLGGGGGGPLGGNGGRPGPAKFGGGGGLQLGGGGLPPGGGGGGNIPGKLGFPVPGGPTKLINNKDIHVNKISSYQSLVVQEVVEAFQGLPAMEVGTSFLDPLAPILK